MHNKDDNFVQLLIYFFLKNEVYLQEVYFQFNNKNCESFISYLYGA